MNEFHEKISIVVPVYQASQYLNDCLDSLAKQTYKNIEVILEMMVLKMKVVIYAIT